MVYGGYLLDNPNQVELDSSVLFGMGFGTQVPIDILGILLLNADISNYNLLLVDEFLRINGTDENEIQRGLEITIHSIEKLCKIYGLSPNVLFASEFMQGTAYENIVEQLNQTIQERTLIDLMVKTVPVQRKEQGIEYPLHEAACVAYLEQTLGVKVKIGPQTEQPYDNVIKKLGIPVKFSYLNPSYAFATTSTDAVVPYSPKARGPNNGQRIYLENLDRISTNLSRQINDKLHGHEEALKYMVRLASAAGKKIKQEYFNPEEINAMHGQKYLKKLAKKLVNKNIVEPYLS